jgi:hypothetical protein
VQTFIKTQSISAKDISAHSQCCLHNIGVQTNSLSWFALSPPTQANFSPSTLKTHKATRD